MSECESLGKLYWFDFIYCKLHFGISSASDVMIMLIFSPFLSLYKASILAFRLF